MPASSFGKDVSPMEKLAHQTPQNLLAALRKRQRLDLSGHSTTKNEIEAIRHFQLQF